MVDFWYKYGVQPNLLMNYYNFKKNSVQNGSILTSKREKSLHLNQHYCSYTHGLFNGTFIYFKYLNRNNQENNNIQRFF